VLRAGGAVDTEGLSGPLGYWNALGVIAAIGVVLAVGLASRASPRVVRAGAVGSLPVLAVALLFTQSRGALVALVFGLLVYFALDPRVRRVALVAAVAALMAAAATSAVWPGGPGDLVSRAYAAFSAPIGRNGEPEESPFTLSGNERAAYWRVAWSEYLEHPVLGSGAGTFAIFWQRDRETIYGAQDAHSLYLETLAELGPVGVLLVGGALAIPLLALRRALPDALERAATAAYVAFLIHAGLDWDWEVPAVTLAGLFCGCAVLLGVPDQRRPISSALRARGLTLVTAVAALVTIGYAGNAAMQRSLQAVALGDLERSDGQAQTAGFWNPWSSDALRVQGEIARARGYPGDAASSFRAAIAIDRNDWRLWYDLALVTEGDEHERTLDEAERLNPLSPEVRALRDR